MGANRIQVFKRVLLPMSFPGIATGITMVFVPAVSTFVISRMLGGGDMLIGDIIEMQFIGSTYNPYIGSALSLVLMVLVFICMAVMRQFGGDEESEAMMP